MLAQIALNMVEGFPAASHLSLQISEILDDLGRYAQWLIGRDKANELLSKDGSLNLQDLYKIANEHA